MTRIARMIRIRSNAAVCAALAVFTIQLSIGTPGAAAIPTDNVLPIPVVGLATGPTGLGGPLVAQHVTVTTAPESPGITRFAGTERPCACAIHWRNVTTGATGTANLWFGPGTSGETAVTGSGTLVATVTASGAGWPITILPGAGLWFVP